MDVKSLSLLLITLIPIIIALRNSPDEDRRAEHRRSVHLHSKRHMLPSGSDPRKRLTSQKPRELRKKPSGHLRPLDEDDMDNDEVVSVAVGPPPVRPKYDKIQWRHNIPKQITNNNNINNTTNLSSATNLIKNVLTQLGREFLTHQVNEDFVFGQYIGNAMRNLTSELKLRMQHEILELIVKYQLINNGEIKTEDIKLDKATLLNQIKNDKKVTINDTDDSWPDFNNLAKIVGRK